MAVMDGLSIQTDILTDTLEVYDLSLFFSKWSVVERWNAINRDRYNFKLFEFLKKATTNYDHLEAQRSYMVSSERDSGSTINVRSNWNSILLLIRLET
jgi:hypothetical protein